MMFHFSFGGPPANGFFEQMAVQASTLKHPRSRMRQGQAEETKRLQREMDMNTNAEDFFFLFVFLFPLDTSFACNREEVWTRPFVQILSVAG